MGTQQAEKAADFGRLPALFRGRDFGRAEQEWSQVAIAKAVECEFEAADRFQQLRIFRRPRLQRADAAAVQFGRLAERLGQFAERSRSVHLSEGVEIATVGRLADLRSAATLLRRMR